VSVTVDSMTASLTATSPATLHSSDLEVPYVLGGPNYVTPLYIFACDT